MRELLKETVGWMKALFITLLYVIASVAMISYARASGSEQSFEQGSFLRDKVQSHGHNLRFVRFYERNAIGGSAQPFSRN